MKLPILVLAVAAITAAGCSSILGGDTENVPLEFSARNVDSAPSPDPAFTVLGGQGQVLVEGVLGTPNPCQDVTAEAEMEGRRLRLTVHARSKPVLCPGVVGRFDYTARLLELKPGTYDLEVIHDYGGSGPAKVRYEAPVTVE